MKNISLEKLENKGFFQENSCGGACFKDSLDYIGPSSGGFGLQHILLQLPESHLIFISPSGCGRHTSLASLKDDTKKRISYYLLTASEIIDGYDDQMEEAVVEMVDILTKMKRRPKAIITIVSCLDNLIGTDNASVVRRLRERIPDIDFQEGHMDPITRDTETPPLVKGINTIYNFLKEGNAKEKTKDVNIIGCFLPLPENNELYKLVAPGKVRQVSTEGSYDEFQKEANSKVNIVMHPGGIYAAKELKNRFGTPFIPMFTTYSIKNIDQAYESLARLLEVDFDKEILDSYRQEAEKTIDKALEIMGDRPIWVSSGGVKRPFDTAKALIEYGFNVEAVLASDDLPFEREAKEWLEINCPNIRYMQADHFSRAKRAYLNDQVLGIGFDAAYQAGSSYVVSLVNDLDLFGYYGLKTLMEEIIDAIKNPKDLKEMIDKANLVI